MSTPDQSTYQVQLPDFEGPLDLLLHLIEREELDISRVSLAQVTDQYMRFLSAAQQADAAGIADFLFVAAKLLFIKSCLLLPHEGTPSAEAEELADDLARQLLQYRRYKQAGVRLRDWESGGLRGYARDAPPPKAQPVLDLSGVSLQDLRALFRAVVDAQRTAPLDPVVAPLVIRIVDKQEDILRRLAGSEGILFRHWLGRSAGRIEIIVSFLAVLELMKARQVVVVQTETFGDILIVAAPQTAHVPDSVPQLIETTPDTPARPEVTG